MNLTEVLLAIIGAVFPPSAFAAIVRYLLQPDLRLDSRRWLHRGKTLYLFVLMNAREQTVDTPITIIIEPLILGEALRTPPTVVGGPVLVGLREPERTGGGGFRFEADRIRPLAMWVFRCRTNGREGDLVMTVRAGKRTIGSARGSARPRRGALRSWSLCAVVTLASVSAYLVVLVTLFRPRGGGAIRVEDGWVMVGLAVASICRVPLDVGTAPPADDRPGRMGRG